MSYTLKDFKVSDKKFKKNIQKDEDQVYSEEEMAIIADYIISNYKSTRELGILLALLTGLRAGELAALKTQTKKKICYTFKGLKSSIRMKMIKPYIKFVPFLRVNVV